jgi:hypothetical protein
MAVVNMVVSPILQAMNTAGDTLKRSARARACRALIGRLPESTALTTDWPPSCAPGGDSFGNALEQRIQRMSSLPARDVEQGVELLHGATIRGLAFDGAQVAKMIFERTPSLHCGVHIDRSRQTSALSPQDVESSSHADGFG